MSSISPQVGFALAIAATALTGCSRGDASGQSSAAAEQSSQASPAVEARDPCSLITKAEAEALLGAELTVSSRGGDGRPTCHYAHTGQRINGFSMTVYWSGGKEALDVIKGGMTIATGMMKSEELDPSSMMKLEPVAGVGDEAYFNPMVGTSVLKDDTLLEFDIRGMMWHQTRESGLELWKQLVATALARL